MPVVWLIDAYRAGERARIRHILLLLAENAPPDVVQAVNAKGQQLYQRIKAGEDFAKLRAARTARS